jgi:hypothetical protein
MEHWVLMIELMELGEKEAKVRQQREWKSQQATPTHSPSRLVLFYLGRPDLPHQLENTTHTHRQYEDLHFRTICLSGKASKG